MRKKIVVAAAVLAMSVGASPHASAGQYMVLVYEAQADLDLRDQKTAESADYWAAFAQFAGLLQKSGMMRGGAPLRDPVTAPTIRAGAPAAKKLASQVPAIARGGAVEVRETYPAPTMMQ